VVPPATTTGEFYRSLAEAMGWPDYFGANLDALWDALTDLSGPTAVILDRWTEFARARPARWNSIVAVFAERCEIDPTVCRGARLEVPAHGRIGHGDQAGASPRR
jgi:RNAse (barnase) inhibitor barstar